ncbi:MAG: hypothetical protein P1T08_18885, partial [Acidimicrobiia bacterium]|nr:hypothetical protein [Acidimicrobiia bacterium]
STDPDSNRQGHYVRPPLLHRGSDTPRAVRFGRFRADDVASILAIGPAAPDIAHPGEQIIVDLPMVEIRSFDAYRIGDLA